ncbi:hypothetical protein [Streptomyces sp. NPDC048637]
MSLDSHFATSYTSLQAVLTTLFVVALAHPDPQIRARAERLLAVIFGAR